MIPALADADPPRARELVAQALAVDPGGSEVTGTDANALLACYGLTVRAAGNELPPAAVATTVEISDDPSFGSVASFGLSGVPLEVFGDRSYRALPLADVDAAELSRSVAAWPLLNGYAGAATVDCAALEDVLLRLARLCDDLPEIARLQVEVLAHPDGAAVENPRVRVRPHSARAEEASRRADRSEPVSS